MDDEKLKYQIGANIAAYRKRAGLTQLALAEKLNYSDKAVSKWERGESIPDVLTHPEALPGNPGTLEKAMTQVSEKALKRKANKNVILALSSTLVWFVALLAFVLMSPFDFLEKYSRLLFFYAIPANAIVLLSLRSAWHDFRWNKMLISAIVWGTLLSIYVTLRVVLQVSYLKLFLLGIPGQIAIFLWFRMFRSEKKENSNG